MEERPAHTAKPPRWADRFLRFYCHRAFLEEIQGDLHELYRVREQERGRRNANFRFIWDVIRFLRWSNIKKPSGSNSNSIAMFRNYFLIANRNLRKEKTYSMLNLLGLYMGFICLILTVVYLNHQFKYDTQHPDADNTYRFLLVDGETGYRSASTAGPWAPKMAEEFPEVTDFMRMGGFATSIFRYQDKQFYETQGALADPSLFKLFKFDFKWGNAETALNEPFNIVLSEAMATKYFGDENPVGQIFQVNTDEQYTITGVLKAEQAPSHIRFNFVASFDSHTDDFRYDWVIQNYTSYVQLQPGADKEDLRARLVDFFERHTPKTGVSIEGRGYDFEPISDIFLRSEVYGQVPNIRRVMTFALIGLFILLIALVNYVNMVTARSTQRLKEVGVRKAIGARKKQLVAQFLSESFYFCFLAFLLAILSVNLFMPAFSELVNASLSFHWLSDLNIVLLLLGITILVGIGSGLYPAAVLSAMRPTNLMKPSGAPSGGRSIFRRLLTGLQFFISIGLIIATAIVNRQLNFINQKDLGFDKEAVMVVSLRNTSIMPNKFAFAERLEQSPFVRSVGLTGQAIGGGDWGMPFRYEGGSEPQSSRFMAVDAKYAETLQLQFLDGRNFSAELASDVDNSYIVNETFMKTVGWTEAVGKRIEMPSRNADGSNSWTPGTVVGVVKDFNYRDLHTNMLPLVISNRLRWTRLLFIKLEPESLTAGIDFVRNAWSEVEGQTPFNYYFLDDRLDQFYEPEVRLSKTAAIYGSLAIVLACFGLFSLATFMAQQRMKEVSIRKVLGASVTQIFVMFSKPFLWIILIASLIAIPTSLYFLRDWLSTFAYSVSLEALIDVPVLALLATLIVAMITVIFQSMKLSRANPVRYLRNE